MENVTYRSYFWQNITLKKKSKQIMNIKISSIRILTGHRSDTLKLVVATSLSGSCASFSFTRNLLNKQSLYGISINKIIIKGCLYLKTGFNLQFGNYNRYWVHAFFGLKVQGLSRTGFLLVKKSMHCKTILINNDHFYLFSIFCC